MTPSRLFLFVLLITVACARTPVVAPPIAEAPLPEATPQPYRLQPGDLLEIKFWAAPELDEEVRIRPDGAISLPFVDDVPAAGLTPAELDAELTKRYARELALPEITVMLRDAVGYSVWVAGEVASQGAIAWERPITLSQAILTAGGITSEARMREIVLIRTLPDGERIARSIDLKPVLTGENPNLDPILQPSDVVWVPSTTIANVNRVVDQYVNGILPLRPVLTIPVLSDPLIDNSPDDGGAADGGDGGGA
ncbi:MAG: polysaccharide biosynthesis/export family protein [Acidobacteriota bacterium]